VKSHCPEAVWRSDGLVEATLLKNSRPRKQVFSVLHLVSADADKLI
jgi:hypothetical protein